MMKNCHQCATKFEITDEDLKFYDQISPVFAGKKYQVPPPQLCPQCRQQRRLAMRNERKLYNRKSDLTGKQIISMFSKDKPLKVYDQSEWWADPADYIEYGRDFDFSKTFSEQLKALYEAVPHVSLTTKNVENSYYTNFALNQKNSYLIFGGSDDQDCMFGKFVITSKDCIDNLSIFSCELCYEGIASEGCYNCRFITDSKNCFDCTMVENCQSSKNCIACFGLKSKEYCYLNEYVGKAKFMEIQKQYEYLTKTKIEYLRKQLNELKAKLPHMSAKIYRSENCTGDTVFNSKNCQYAFDTTESEDSKYLYFTKKTINSYDCTFNSPDGVKFSYNICSSLGESLITAFHVWASNNTYYSIESHNSRNLFGCVGLRNKKYCILNKQYTQEEYEKLAGRIIEHMRAGGEWGEYFPYKLSAFGYNESIAQEYFPLTKEEALKIGANWHESEIETVYQGENVTVPDDIRDVDDDICKKIMTCEISKKHFKIIPQELKFYRKMKLPIPTKCPDQRHLERVALHKPNKLHDRKCTKCNAAIKTIYAPDRPEKVYCESCYLKEVY